VATYPALDPPNFVKRRVITQRDDVDDIPLLPPVVSAEMLIDAGPDAILIERPRRRSNIEDTSFDAYGDVNTDGHRRQLLAMADVDRLGQRRT
jgi:hypothetical protein